MYFIGAISHLTGIIEITSAQKTGLTMTFGHLMQTLVLLDLKESIRKLNDTALQAPTLPSPARKNGEQGG